MLTLDGEREGETPGMDERRATPRHRVTENGLIAIDEHTSIPCMLYDISEGGVRLTLPDTGPVPDTFVLVSPCLGEVRVCAVAWRTDETIGAQFKTAA